MSRGRFRRTVALTLAVMLVLGALPASAAKKDAAPKGARIEGAIRDVGGKPVAGVKIILTPLQAQGSTISTVSDASGKYAFERVPHGVYEASLLSGNDVYAANRVLLVSPGKKLEASFQLGPFQPQDQVAGLGPGQKVPGVDRPATGVARLDEKLGPTGVKWLRTGKGVAVLVGAGALLVGGLIALGEPNKNKQVSPTTTGQ